MKTFSTRKLFFVSLLCASIVFITEVLAYLTFFLLTGEMTPWNKAAGAIQTLEKDGTRAQLAGNASEQELQSWRHHEIVHPFLGFVMDRDQQPENFDDYGFYEHPKPDDDALKIGIFGGSVAWAFAYGDGKTALVRELKKNESFRTRSIVVRNFALGGYKQPQQLMTLSYLLTLGETFDIVINLDGFNEIALSAQNLKRGVFPLYPMQWDRRVRFLPAGDAQQKVGEIVYLRERRRERARAFDFLLCRYSATCNLLWLVQDRALDRRIGALQEELESISTGSRSFVANGPERDYADLDSLFAEVAKVWRRSSIEMHQLCKANGIRYYHFLQPNQYVAGSKPLSRVEQLKFYNPEHPYGRYIAQGYGFLVSEGAALRASKVAFYDISMAFANVRETLYVDDCCHLNLKGNEIVARSMARAILADIDKR